MFSEPHHSSSKHKSKSNQHKSKNSLPPLGNSVTVKLNRREKSDKNTTGTASNSSNKRSPPDSGLPCMPLSGELGNKSFSSNRRSWSESDLLREIDYELKLAKGFLFADGEWVIKYDSISLCFDPHPPDYCSLLVVA